MEPSGHGANLSLSITEETLRASGKVVYSSPHYIDYSYAMNNSNYSSPVVVSVMGLSIPASSKFTSRLQLSFWNNDRNLQLLVPMTVNVTCKGVDACFVPLPPPPSPPPPLPPAPPPPATHTPWKSVGPWNIGDDVHGNGEAGTIQVAVSPISNPLLMYMGGNNNAASSGVLKTINGGKHWAKVNVGLWDTRIHGLFLVDDDGDHVLVGTPSGVFESLDGGISWVHVDQTRPWGQATSFKNGTIGGRPTILIGASGGLGNVPLLKNLPLINQTWSLIPSPPGHAAWRTNWVSVSDFRNGKPLANSVVGGCLWPDHRVGVVHIASLTSETTADWKVQLDQPCQSLAMDPNNADHLLVNNASNGAHIYESTDGGASYHGCLNLRGQVMVVIDRQGWFYTGSEGGALRNVKGCVEGKWEAYFVRRIARRTGGVRDRTAHDYQGINIDFAGGVAFGSDQGMFIKNGTELMLISANGDVNNNIIMHPSIAEGDAPGETCIVTAIWDWSPIASWDSGKHWPSWQKGPGVDDGNAMGYFGEGGGCFGVGKSKNVLCMHHHNVAHSSRCGKNMSRFVVPHGASVGGHQFTRKRGSRSEPSGMIYAPLSMGRPPWDTLPDQSLGCPFNTSMGDLGVHTSYSCLSHVDIGLLYGWWRGANVAVWRGDTDKHCIICKLDGNRSSWGLQDTRGSIVYALETGAEAEALHVGKAGGDNVDDDSDDDEKEDGDSDDVDGDSDDDGDGDGDGDGDDAAMVGFKRHLHMTMKLEWNKEEGPRAPVSGLDLQADAKSAGNPMWVLKSWNYGANWTWILLPDFLQALHGFAVDPSNDTTLYGITHNCIGRSYDQAETWEYCWDIPGLESASINSLVIKDSQTMLIFRSGLVPLRTRDGGRTWTPLASLQAIAKYNPGAEYSWSGKTLALSCVIGRTVVWVSKDDGDTWVDESGDYTATSGGIAQWYENTLFISSLGQGISSKVFDEA